MDLNEWNTLTQILVGGATVLGSVYAVYRVVKAYVFKPLTNHIKYVITRLNKIDELSEKLNGAVLPIIESLNKEFSINSGKSIKDQINQIANSVRLAELRSKLIASSFSNIGMYECDSFGNFVWVNKAVCDMYGISHEDLMGNGWLYAVVDDEREEVLAKWLNSIKNNIPYDTSYTVHNVKTKEQFVVKTTAIPNKSSDGRILGYYGQLIRD